MLQSVFTIIPVQTAGILGVISVVEFRGLDLDLGETCWKDWKGPPPLALDLEDKDEAAKYGREASGERDRGTSGIAQAD